MKLNAVEKALMNNPVRAASQRHYEARLLRRLGGSVPAGSRTLEVGCGRGVGVEIILNRFGAAVVDAFDFDPDMVQRAQRRLARHGDRVRIWEGDITAIDAPDGVYDAVFDFGAIHHVPDWRKGIHEIARVLRPGGVFYFEEVTAKALNRWSYRTFLEHPKEDRPTSPALIAEIEQAGITVADRWVEHFFGDFLFGAGIH